MKFHQSNLPYKNTERKTQNKEVTLGPSDFPYTLEGVKGSSRNQGNVMVYRNGKHVDDYNITFRRVKD